MNILVTNDDSHRSPLLRVAVDYFSSYGDVHLVVPLHEQSWTGKSLSRFSPLHVQTSDLCGRKGFSVSGTPADCVNMAIYNLLPKPPDLVVSGINAGFNLGVGFILSSGTVGACLEANLAGIPAIAISQAFDTATRNRYSAEYLIEQPDLIRFSSNAKRVLDVFLERVMSPQHKDRFLRVPVTWNVNLPFELQSENPLRAAHLGHTRYARCFHEDPPVSGGGNDAVLRTFRHRGIAELMDADPECDTSVIAQKCATLSVVDVWALSKGDGCREGKELLGLFS